MLTNESYCEVLTLNSRLPLLFKSFSFFKEINTFIQQERIKLIKSDSKDILVQINAVLLNFLFIKES